MTFPSNRHPASPLPPRETLPTMYDLPDEELDYVGWRDIFHTWQARLLDETFCPPNHEPTEFFTASKLNVYYDALHVYQYKRPDWFAVVGLPKYAPQPTERMKYVTWEESCAPLIVIELLWPGMEGDVLGQPRPTANPLLTKWNVYQHRMRVPYYVVFSPDDAELRIFTLRGMRYQEAQDQQGRFWIEDIALGLGLWQGRYGAERKQKEDTQQKAQRGQQATRVGH